MSLKQKFTSLNSDISNVPYLKWTFIAICLMIFVRWMYIIENYSVNVLFYDHWDLYTAFFQKHSLWDIYNWQHGPHRQGIGFVLTKYIDMLSSWDTKWISITIGIFIACSTVLLLLIKKRLTGKLTMVDLVIPIMMLTPSQYGVFANTPNISHGAMPIFLVCLFCLSLYIDKVSLRVSLMVILNFLIIYSGFGLLFGLICPFIFLIYLYYEYLNRNSLIYYSTGFLLSCIFLAIYFQGYRHAPANPNFQFIHDKPFEYIIFMAKMIKTAISIPKGVGDVVSYILLIFQCYIIVSIILGLIKRKVNNLNLELIVLILIGYTFLFEFATAVGRVSFGTHVASASRYAPYVLPGLIGTYIYCITRFKMNYVFLGLVSTFMIFGLWSKDSYVKMNSFKVSKEAWIKNFKTTKNINLANNISQYPIYPDTTRNNILNRRLKYLKKKKLNLFKEN